MTRSVLPFEFATAQQIVFGRGAIAQLPALAARYGLTRLLVVTGATPARHQAHLEPLRQAGIFCSTFALSEEPSLSLLHLALEQAEDFSADGVVALGGGSVLDLGKAVAALMTNPGEPLEFLEVIGRGRPLTRPGLPFLAVPTTAGTGTEVTRNAVLYSPEHRVKVSLRSPHMLPAVALIDPELTRSMPAPVTVASGMDALTQLIEPYVSLRANPLTDALCREALPRAAQALPRVFRSPEDMEARTAMSLASLCGGLALANAGLGVVHGLAGPLGGLFQAPHGALCAALLPSGMEVNIRCLRRLSTAEAEASLARYRTVARLLLSSVRGPEALGAAVEPEDGVIFVRQLCQQLEVPTLANFGMTADDTAAVVERAARASSMKANPVALTADEVGEIYRQSL